MRQTRIFSVGGLLAFLLLAILAVTRTANDNGHRCDHLVMGPSDCLSVCPLAATRKENTQRGEGGLRGEGLYREYEQVRGTVYQRRLVAFTSRRSSGQP